MSYPVWLGHDLTEHQTLIPTACSMDLSTSELPKATLTMAIDQRRIGIHDFVELTDLRGRKAVFRAVSYSYNYGQTSAAQLIGAADTLSDDVYDEEADEALEQPAYAWIYAILEKQTTVRWQRGICELVADVKIKTNYQDLWSLLEMVRQARPGYWWEFDYTTTPWTLNLRAMPNDVVSEFRLSRNISSAQISITDQDLCNRLIFTVSNNDGSSSVTTHDNLQSQAAYGIRARCTDIKAEDIPTGMTAADYAAQLLAQNASPIVTIQITGADLQRLTGDDFDRITLGSRCRAILPDLGDPIIERVVALSWPDVYGQPDSIRATLSTEPASFTGSLASAKKIAKAVKSARGGGGGGAAKADVDGWAKVLTETIDAVDGTGISEMWQSGIQMTAMGGVRVFSLYQGLSSLDSELVLTNTRIAAEVTRAEGAETTLSGLISLEAGKIALVVEETQGGNVIKAASIVTAINQAGSTVKIEADHIELNGDTIATYLYGKNVSVDELTASYLSVGAEGIRTSGDLLVQGEMRTTGTFKVGNTAASWQQATVADGNGGTVMLHYIGRAST